MCLATIPMTVLPCTLGGGSARKCHGPTTMLAQSNLGMKKSPALYIEQMYSKVVAIHRLGTGWIRSTKYKCGEGTVRRCSSSKKVYLLYMIMIIMYNEIDMQKCVQMPP